MTDLESAREALWAIPASIPRDDWVRIGMAAQDAGLGLDDFDAWSATGDTYNPRDVRDVWRSFKPGGGVGAGTLFEKAHQHGWHRRAGEPRAHLRDVSAPRAQAAGNQRQMPGPRELLGRFAPATAAHPYATAKGAPEEAMRGLYVVPEGDPLRIAGEPMAGALVVPVGESSLQFIAVGETARRLKEQGRPTKLNLPGHSLRGTHVVGELQAAAVAYLCEGIGQAWACWRATGAAAVVTFGWSRMRAVATDLKHAHPSARLVVVPDVGKEDDAEKLARDLELQYVSMPGGWPQNADVADLVQRDGCDALEALLATPRQPAGPFAIVPVEDLARLTPEPPEYVWSGLVPAAHVTLFAAHGGTGKTLLALMLSVSVALGRPLFGRPTRAGVVVFFSGEDGAKVLRYRLALVCRCMEVDPVELAGRLIIVDATDHDPTLYAEINLGGRQEGTITPTYSALAKLVADRRAGLVIVDNASDAFDASEIGRARVRGFMRALARIARANNAGVLLLAHVDKGTSRRERADTEGYSGSTAWNNSARSRLFMARDAAGLLVLEQQKHNLGRLSDPIKLTWPEGGIPQVDEPLGPIVQGISDRGNERAILKLIAEYTDRGEPVSTATTSRTHAGKVLRHEPTFPRIKDTEVFDLLRKAERAGYIVRDEYKGPDRKSRERWLVTDAGRAFAGLPAATAATAATSGVTAPAHLPQGAAATAATSPLGGVGERARTEVTAEHMGVGDE